MIAWKYLNKPSATVAALQDYSTMRDIINITCLLYTSDAADD